ncbi:MAG: hypothetical protein HYY17_13775 [Planctomycetes bacterium]|nr:hypothetical protein [Planctomycetota bacterium]
MRTIRALFLAALAGCWPESEHVQIISNDCLGAAVCDNEPLALYGHQSGYSGLAKLRHEWNRDRDIFVPFLAGLNYETNWLRGAPNSPWEIQAEPRFEPMTLRRIDERTVELHQEETSVKHIEALLRFRIHNNIAAVDFDFTFTPRQAPPVENPNFGPDVIVMFANYMCDPADPRLYAFGHTPGDPRPRWLRYEGIKHGDYWVEERDGSGEHVSPGDVTLDRPYMAGKVGGMLVAWMVETPGAFGIYYSPNGDMSLDYKTPAWDFTLSFRDVAVGQPLTARGRLIVVPMGTLRDVEPAYQAWR